MKKFASILVLMIFVNFTALPGIAAVFGIKIAQINMTVSEEEHGSTSLIVYEKSLPKTLNIHDFVNFFQPSEGSSAFILWNDCCSRSPFFSIPSPPPEV